MLYYLAKMTQAAGLALIAAGFLKNFPHLIDRNFLMTGIFLFGIGWMMRAFLLKR